MSPNQTQADARPRLVMVLGASHSGTTMLDLMLGNNDATFSTGEVWAAFHPYRKHHFEPTCGCGQANCPVWTKLLEVPEDKFHFTAATQPGVNNVVDSSKDLTWIIDAAEHAKKTGMQMHNVVIWKQPIELAYSYYKRDWTLDFFRSKYLGYYERFLDTQLPFISVRFSQLIADPATVLQKICSMTGLPWQEGQEEFWVKDHHHMFGARNTARQSRAGESKIREATSYPEEFLTKFDDFARAMTKDARLMRVIGALESMDIDKIYMPRIAADGTPAQPAKPGWYYAHKLKRIYKRYFPENYVPRTIKPEGT